MFFFTKRPSQARAIITSPRSDSSLLPNADASDTLSSDPGASIERPLELKPRQDSPPTTEVSTCGYLNGNGAIPRVAASGYDCRVDTQNAIWGFCPTTVSDLSGCGLAGGCVDAHSCNSGCGISGDPFVTTFTCTGSKADYCSLALLINGPDQTYSYLGCASAAITYTYYNTPTATSLQTSTLSNSALSGAKPSITFASSTSSATSSPAISAALASSSSLSTATPSPSNNTGAIVGSILGALALLSLLVVAFLFYRWLKRRHAKEAQDNDPVWQHSEFQGALLMKAPKEGLVPAELSNDGSTAELSAGDKHSETAELPNDIRRSGHALEY